MTSLLIFGVFARCSPPDGDGAAVGRMLRRHDPAIAHFLRLRARRRGVRVLRSRSAKRATKRPRHEARDQPLALIASACHIKPTYAQSSHSRLARWRSYRTVRSRTSVLEPADIPDPSDVIAQALVNSRDLMVAASNIARRASNSRIQRAEQLDVNAGMRDAVTGDKAYRLKVRLPTSGSTCSARRS